MNSFVFKVIVSLLCLINCAIAGPEEAEGVKYADKCEVCKVVVTELEDRLGETGKTHDVLEIGYSVDDVAPKKRKEYKKSQLRLVESLDELCDRILKYNIHKERKDSTRFEKGMSQTFKTLHGLVDKGVKVDLGIPYELWDNPSVEVTTLKSSCETLLEAHEEDIENWYYNHQGKIPLSKYLCTDRYLKGENNSCLSEKGDRGKIEDKSSKKKVKASKKKESKPDHLKNEL